MKQERADRCGSDPLVEIFELEKNYGETTIGELESFLFSLQRLKETGCNEKDETLDGWIDITKQAIRIKTERDLG